MLPPDSVSRARPSLPPPPPPPPVKQVESRPGESLVATGKRFGVSEQQMTRSNPGVSNASAMLPDNTRINIPTGTGNGVASTHVVQAGESPADIAAQQKVSESDLRAANGFGPGEAVYAGTTLLLPVKGGDNGDPTTTAGLTDAFPSLAGRDPVDLKKITDNVAQLRDGSTSEKIRAVAELARDLKPEDIGKLFKELGIADNPVAKLATDSAALGALSSLANPDASAYDKASAVLTLTKSVGELAPGQLGQVLKPYLSALPSANALIGALDTYSDPDASALDKAKATLELGNALKETLGDNFPKLADALRHTDSFSRSLSAGLTLLDPDASVQDKAKAAIELGAEVPELAGDARAIKAFLQSNGLSEADARAIQQGIDNLPIAERLPESVRTNLDPEVARNLTPAQADQLAKMAADGELKDALPDAIKRIKDPEAMKALLGSLDGIDDAATRKTLLTGLAGLKEGVADKLLTSTIDGKPAGDVLGSVLGKLDVEGQAKFAKLIKDFDEGTLKFALQLGEQVDGKVLGQALDVIGDSKLAGQALGALHDVLSKAGVKVTGEIAEKVLKGIGKIVPIAGALPAGYDAVRMGKIAADTSLPADIRYLALQASKLNGVDAVLSVAEPFIAEFFGIPVAADIALGVAELGLDLVISDQKAKSDAQGSDYQAPDWLKGLNVGLAAAQGPQGVAELALIYGPNGAVDLAGAVTRLGGEGAIKAGEVSAELTAQGVGEGLHYTAEGLHQLADIIRNPSKYGAAAVELGKQAVDQLSDIAQGAGELAEAAAKELGNLVGDLKKLGAEGVEALGWIASHPGEAAQKAVDALSNAAEWGLRIGTQAGKEIARDALAALGTARDALGAAGEAAQKAIAAIDGAIDKAVDTAVSLGKRGIATLGWIAANPGAAADIAKDALVDVASQAGEMAKQAYDQIVKLGADGVELAKDVAGKLVDAGEAGVEMLKYVVDNPGKAAEEVRKAALEGLKTIANGVGAAAEAATDAVIGFVDNGLQEAKDTASDLLTAGGDAAERIAAAWGDELSDGAKEVIGGLKDLGDAGLDALGDLTDAGIGFAGDVLGGLKSTYDNTIGRIPGL